MYTPRGKKIGGGVHFGATTVYIKGDGVVDGTGVGAVVGLGVGAGVGVAVGAAVGATVATHALSLLSLGLRNSYPALHTQW